MREPRRIVIDKTDALGDAVLAFPMAGLLKQRHPSASLLYLGRAYVRAAVECCEHFDGFLDWDEVMQRGPAAQTELLRSAEADAIVHLLPRKPIVLAARRAGIGLRVGHARRWWGLAGPNRWLFFSRRRSGLHEAQLNVKMLRPFGIERVPGLDELPRHYGMTRVPALRPELEALLDPQRINVVLCPVATRNAPAWGVESYAALLERLPPERYQVFVTGLGHQFGDAGEELDTSRPNVRLLVDELSLEDLIALIARSEAVVAGSTGPLHVAAALGRCAIGIYSPRPSKAPARWGPVGVRAHALVHEPGCPRCARRQECDCIRRTPPAAVLEILEPLTPGLGVPAQQRVDARS